MFFIANSPSLNDMRFLAAQGLPTSLSKIEAASCHRSKKLLSPFGGITVTHVYRLNNNKLKNGDLMLSLDHAGSSSIQTYSHLTHSHNLDRAPGILPTLSPFSQAIWNHSPADHRHARSSPRQRQSRRRRLRGASCLFTQF